MPLLIVTTVQYVCMLTKKCMSERKEKDACAIMVLYYLELLHMQKGDIPKFRKCMSNNKVSINPSLHMHFLFTLETCRCMPRLHAQ